MSPVAWQCPLCLVVWAPQITACKCALGQRVSKAIPKAISRPDVAQQHADEATPLALRVLHDGRVSRRDAATFLGMEPKTLAEWHSKGIGPKSRMVGGRRFYQIEDLRAFAGCAVSPPVKDIEL